MLFDLCLEIRCFPVPSYHRDKDPVERIRRHPKTEMFLPLPCLVHSETPLKFGKPIQTEGYSNGRPCGIFLEQHTVLIDIGKRVRFSASPESLLFSDVYLRSRSSILLLSSTIPS